LIADSAGIEYTTGLEKDKKMRSSTIDMAISKFKEQKDEPELDEGDSEQTIEEMKKAADERATGLMSRSK